MLYEVITGWRARSGRQQGVHLADDPFRRGPGRGAEEVDGVEIGQSAAGNGGTAVHYPAALPGVITSYSIHYTKLYDTTDFSLIQISEQDGQLALERIAVGDHLLVGGDNMA